MVKVKDFLKSTRKTKVKKRKAARNGEPQDEASAE